MRQLTVNISDELAQRLRPHEQDISRILELGLCEYSVREIGEFSGTAQVLEFLATLPSPEEIMQLRPSDELQKRLDQLLEKSRIGNLTETESTEWKQYQQLEHLVRMAKIRAKAKLS